MKNVLIFILAIGFLKTGTAQKRSKLITGTVVLEGDQRPVEGALVWVKGTKNFSGTQPDGIYFIEINPTDTSLLFSYKDLKPVEIKLTQETEYNVILPPHPINNRNTKARHIRIDQKQSSFR
jgi:hypothetical protein